MADEKKPTPSGSADDSKPSLSRATPNRDKPRAAPVVEGRPGDVREVKPGASQAAKSPGSASQPSSASPAGGSTSSSSGSPARSPAASVATSSASSASGSPAGSAKSATDSPSTSAPKSPTGGAAAKPAGDDGKKDGKQESTGADKAKTPATASAAAASSSTAASKPATASSPPKESGGGFGGAILGGAVGALVALAAVWAYQTYAGDGEKGFAALNSKVGALETRLADQNKAVAALKSTQDRSAAAQGQTLTPVKKQIAALESDLKQQSASTADDIKKLRSDLDALAKRAPDAGSLAPVVARIAALEKRLDTAKSSTRAKDDPVVSGGQTPTPPATAAGTDVSALVARAEKALEPELKKLTARLDSLEVKVKPPADLRPIQNKISALEKKLDPISKQLEPMEGTLDRQGKLAASAAKIAASNSKAIAATGKQVAASVEKSNAAATAIVARTLFERVSAGQPFEELLSAAAALGGDEKHLSVLKPLAAQGVPSRADLVRDFGALENSLLQSQKPAADASLMDKLKQGAMSLVKIRPVGQTKGDSPGAIVTQIKSAFRAGQLERARALFDKLPKPAQDKAQDFVAKLEARINAQKAAAGLLSAALGQLRAGKS